MNPIGETSIDSNEFWNYYSKRIVDDFKNIKRVKKFYNDDESFDILMNRLIKKDAKRFERLLDKDSIPNSWRIFYMILDIVHSEGKEVHPFDTLTRSLESKTMIYHKWTFSWVHGESTLISIFNPQDELVYRF